MKRLVVLTVFFLFFASGCLSVEIAKDGVAVAEIVLPEKPSKTEVFAADELRRYVEKISSAEFKVISEGNAKDSVKIFIGKCSASENLRNLLIKNEPDSFVVKVVNGNLYLFGATDRATLYAVYDFLEDDLGCRWLAPGPQWEEIPRKNSIVVNDLERIESPDMRYRYMRFTVIGEPGSKQDYCMDWAVKQKINIGHYWPPEEKPGQIEKRGNFLGWMGPHTLSRLFDTEKAYKQHPEWFALLDGKRTKKDYPLFVNFCTTNEELINAVAKALGEVFDKWPEIEFLPLGPGDGTWFCECDKCRALDVNGKMWTDHKGKKIQVLTERWLTFVNTIAGKLKKTHPGKKIYTIVYHQTFAAPEPEIIKPLDNVMVQVVNCRPNYTCFLHKVTRKDCPKNKKFCVGLEKWSEITSAGLMVYQYAPHSQFCGMPYPAVHKFVDDIKYMSKHRVIGHEAQSGISCLGFYTPALYACAKTTWDTNTDADELIQEYCRAAYHEAAEPMIKLIKLYETGLEQGGHSSFGIWPGFNDDLLKRARSLFSEAESMAKSDVVKYRLASAKVHVTYSERAFEAWKIMNEAIEKNDEELKNKAIAKINEASKYTKDFYTRDPIKYNFKEFSGTHYKFEGMWLNRLKPEVRE